MKETILSYILGNATNNTISNSTDDSIFGNYDHSDLTINTKLILGGVFGLIATSALHPVAKQMGKSLRYNLAGLVSNLPTMMTVCSSALFGAALYVSESVSNEISLSVPLALLTLLLTLEHGFVFLKPDVDADVIGKEQRRQSLSQHREEMGKKWNTPNSKKKQRPLNQPLLISEEKDTTEINVLLKKLVKASFIVVTLGGGTAWLAYFLTNKNSSGATVAALITTSTLSLTANCIFRCKARGAGRRVIHNEVKSPSSRSRLDV